MKEYDFRPLDKVANPNPLPPGINANKTKLPVFGVVIIACGIILLAVMGVVMLGASIADVLLLYGTLFGAGYVLFRWSRAHKFRRARILSFAAANELEYRERVIPEGMNGLIFDEGRDKTIEEQLLFPDGMEIGRYSYVTGHGKNQQTHSYSYIRVSLFRHLPNMVLDAKKNNLWKFTNLPDSFDPSQQLRLEGDFNEHFNLYVPKEYEQDALYVFTPDVMQALIENGKEYDIEVVDDKLYFYTPSKIDLASQVNLQNALTMVNIVSSEFTHQSNRYSDDRVIANHSGAKVAESGQRLKKTLNPFFIVIVMIVIGYFLLQFIPLILDTM